MRENANAKQVETGADGSVDDVCWIGVPACADVRMVGCLHDARGDRRRLCFAAVDLHVDLDALAHAVIAELFQAGANIADGGVNGYFGGKAVGTHFDAPGGGIVGQIDECFGGFDVLA